MNNIYHSYDICHPDNNDAIEQELLDNLQVHDGHIRFYNWTEEAVFLGRSQPLKFIKPGIDVLKRRTGGGAIYMAKDALIYTIMLNEPGIKVKDTLATIEGIIESVVLKDVKGVTVNTAEIVDKYKSIECFNSINNGEITVNGKKILGTAVTMLDGVYYQQGIIYTTDSHNKLQEWTVEDSSKYVDRITNLKDVGINLNLHATQLQIYDMIRLQFTEGDK